MEEEGHEGMEFEAKENAMEEVIMGEKDEEKVETE
jgi:hypothetical protein